MDIFVSPTAAVLARFVCFVAGSVLAVLIVLTVWDEDVLNVEHILTIMTVLGGKHKQGRLSTYVCCKGEGEAMFGKTSKCVFNKPTVKVCVSCC